MTNQLHCFNNFVKLYGATDCLISPGDLKTSSMFSNEVKHKIFVLYLLLSMDFDNYIKGQKFD